MARTKRKGNILSPAAPVSPEPAVKRYKTAGYARLSVEDSGKPGAETIDIQKNMLTEYIKNQPDLEYCDLYFDNGETGTDFHRPGFERLMEDVRKGNINCIVVKDLSRFGRNYKETGNYLERIFPFLGVRFIAVNDNFDTLTAERSANGYIVPLKNLINETYSRDISKKISGALHIKQQRGDFIGAWAPYGYSKNPEDTHKLIPNPDTAPIVQRMFQMRLNGMAYGAIARTLNREGIYAPTRYLYSVGLCKSEKYAKSLWEPQNVKLILTRQVYLGHMVQGVKRQSFYDGRKQYFRAEDEWAVVRNTHEPIIDEDTFNRVQEMARASCEAYHAKEGRFDALGKTENLLQGLIYCADCGRPLVRYKNVLKNGEKVWYTFICQQHTNDPESCPLKSIREDELFPVLEESISKQIALAVDLEELTITANNHPSNKRRAATLEGQLEEVQKRLKRCQSLRDSLYQNYVEQLMTEREYITMKERYSAEEAEHTRRIVELQAQIEESKVFTPKNPYLEAFRKIQGQSVLSRNVLQALIDRIEIGAGDSISIQFRYQDEYKALTEYLEEVTPDEYRSKVSSHIE